MSLLIAGTRDQALLTVVIQEAEKVTKERGGYVGRTALQKIMYFLKVLEVPMRYRFDIHQFGPFCSEILADTEILKADDVIKDLSPSPAEWSNYQPSVALTELVEKHAKYLEEYGKQIEIVVKALMPLEPDRLELISTLDYLYRWVKATAAPGPYKDQVIARFMKLKGDRFDRKDVEDAYDALAEAELMKE